MLNVLAMITGFAVILLGMAAILVVGAPLAALGTVREQVVMRSRRPGRYAEPEHTER